jgi:heme-degrading monooxygenase HmoA
MEFHLLKGPEAEDHTLYSSHTTWETKAHFEGWTKSEQFRKAHERASNQSSSAPLYIDHPKFEGFEVKLTQGRKEGVAA